MKTIWKYDLKILNKQVIDMPKRAEILTVQNQYGSPRLWVKLEPSNELESRTIIIHGTGQPIYKSNESYIGTCLDDNFVWHVFEELCD